jgi:hypothetical protein
VIERLSGSQLCRQADRPVTDGEWHRRYRPIPVLDPETWVVAFWGERFDVPVIADEVAWLTPPIDNEDYYGATPPDGWDDVVAAWGRRLSWRRGCDSAS